MAVSGVRTARGAGLHFPPAEGPAVAEFRTLDRAVPNPSGSADELCAPRRGEERAGRTERLGRRGRTRRARRRPRGYGGGVVGPRLAWSVGDAREGGGVGGLSARGEGRARRDVG